jgi:RNA polymerase sigma factor (TIGR02999 family)
MSDVTRILGQIEDGDGQAAEKLLPLVYDELRKLAAAKMAQENPGQTLQATALVHEAYIRLVDAKKTRHWDSRGHFFSAAAEAMRRILVERARRQGVRERHGLGCRVDLEENAPGHSSPSFDLLAVDEALTELEKHDSQAAELVKLRFFAGLTHEEAAGSIGVTKRVADRLWRVARAWLFHQVSRG